MKCSPSETVFPPIGRKPVVCHFDGGEITSDSGLLFLRQADSKLRLIDRMSASIYDKRASGKIKHDATDLLRERIFAISAGYDDANDLDKLSRDPGLLLACDKQVGSVLASQPTLSRFENSIDSKDIVCIFDTLAAIVLEQLSKNTRSVVLDVDATDDPCHGQQEFQFYNHYYKNHCYLPLYLHVTGSDGVQRLMGAMLRPGNAGPKRGLFILLRRAIALLRERNPNMSITFRADGAFGDGEILNFCEDNKISYTLALRGNSRLDKETDIVARKVIADTVELGIDQKQFVSFNYRAQKWRCERRVIAKVETVLGKLNIRYVLTSRPSQQAKRVYQYYCERGDLENRIKEMKNDISAGRTSCHRFRANQFRLQLHTAACILWRAVQDALQGTRWETKQIGTLRLMVVKIAARINQTSRRINLHLPTNSPYKEIWMYLHQSLSPPFRI